MKKLTHLAWLLAWILTAAVVFSACAKEAPSASSQAASEAVSQAQTQELGEGKTQFALKVVDGDGNEAAFTIHTDEETVGAALMKLELIAGDEGDFGLYIKTVNGITADYDKDKTYWAFYVNDEYAMTGVDATAIDASATYMLKVEK